MKDLETIACRVFSDINERSVMVHYKADLNDVAPFMCSPFNEEWFWSNEIQNIVNYVFEIIIADYLINDVMAFGDFNNVGNKDFDFLQSVEIYKKYKTMNNQRTESINRLVVLYNLNINKKLSYLELVKLLIEIEKCSPGAGIDLEFESFSSPLETRHSRNLSVEKFDYKNLRKNF